MSENKDQQSASESSNAQHTTDRTTMMITLNMGSDVPERPLVSITAEYHWALNEQARSEIEKLMEDLYGWIANTVF